jgi:hypothetical protein
MGVLTAFPRSIIAGDTVRVTREYGDFSAPTWTATLYGESSKGIFASTAAADGNAHAFTLTAAESGSIAAGGYLVVVRVSDGTVVESVESFWLQVQVNPASPGNRDTRSSTRQLLEAVQAAIKNRATSDQLAMSIEGRSIQRTPLLELLEWETRLKSLVAAEDARGSGRNIRNIKVRLGRA